MNENEDAVEMLSQVHFDIQNKRKRRLNITDTGCCKKPQVRTRITRIHKLLVCNDDGNLQEITPKDITWYLLYIKEPPRNKDINQMFRNRFRAPYSGFLTLLDNITNIHYLQSTIELTALCIDMWNCLSFYYDHYVTLSGPGHLMIWKSQQQFH